MNKRTASTFTATTFRKSTIMKTKSKLRHFLLLAASSLLAVSSASAGQTWDGGSLTDSNWNTADNWDSNTLPTFLSAITFTGTTRAANTNDLATDTPIGGINFNNATEGQAFSISGNRITLGGNITTTASSGAGITDTVSLAMILNGNRTITANTLHNLDLSGSINETGSARTLTKSGTGTLTLSGNNSYSGVTSIGNGILAIAHNNALGTTAGNTTIAATGSNNGPRLTLSGSINSSENISISGTTETGNYAAVIFNTSGTNTLSGTITLASPSNGIRLGSGGGDLILAGTINQTGTAKALSLSATGGGITVNNAIANGGAALAIISQGGGVTLKAAPGTGIGAVSIRERGLLKLGVNNAIRTDQTLTIGDAWNYAGSDQGTFDLAGFNQTVSALSGNKNTTAGMIGADNTRIVTNSAASGTSTLTVGNNNGSGTFNGVINDGATAKVALTKTGTGSQTLAGAGTYSGPTTISNGNLVLGNALAMQNSALDTTGSITGTGSVGLRTTATTLTFGGLTGNKNFATSGGVFDTDNGGYGSVTALTLNPGTGASHSYAGVIANGAANMTLTKTGAGTQTLAGANTYSGATIISAGTLKLGANAVIPDASNVSIGTATLDADIRTDTVGTLNCTGAAVINLGSGGALVFANSSAITWSGTLDITGTLGATSLCFGIGGLSVGQLAKISVNGSGRGNYVLDANGYLVVDAPRAVTFNPADNAINVAEAADLVVTFNQTVSKGTGNIEIKKTSDNSVLETIDVTSGLVTVSGAEATINPSADLPSGVECYVLIAAGAFTNANGSFAGITATTTWSFKTTGALPTLTSIVDNKSGGTIATNTLVTYTVTFSEDMDAATVSADDFGNAGSATVTIGTVTEITPGVFAVPVTPTSGGSLQLQINAGAELKNVFEVSLVTTPALLDETTLTVDDAAPTPNLMTFASPPSALGHTSISMTATTATDPSGVQYFFACTAGGGPDSGWQSSAVFTPTGLNRDTTYSYTVRARDAVFNETTPSDPASATTLAGAINLYSSGGKSWNTTTTNWGSVSGGPYNNAVWNSGDSAIFEGTAGTVTLGVAITVSNLTINTAGYTITGNTLNFATGSTITVPNPPNTTLPGATIESNITGAPAVNATPMDGDEPFTFKPAASGSMVLGNVTGDGAGNGSNRIYFQGGAGSISSVGTVSGPKTFWNGSGQWTLTGQANGYAHEILSGTLIVSGSGSLRASNRNTLLSGGTLHYNNPGAVEDPSATSGANQDFQLNGGSLDNTRGAAITTSTYNPNMYWSNDWTFIGSNGADSDLYLGNGGVILSATRQVTVQNAATTLALGGVISGAGVGLTKAGAGTLELRGVNTYTGKTTVNAGTLLIKSLGSLHASSAVEVTGGTLSGNGSINGPVTVSNVGSIAPGTPAAPTGTLTINNNCTITNNLNITVNGTLSSKLVVTNALTIISGATINVTELTPPPTGALVIASYNTLVGTFETVNSPTSMVVDHHYQGNQIALIVPPKGTIISFF